MKTNPVTKLPFLFDHNDKRHITIKSNTEHYLYITSLHKLLRADAKRRPNINKNTAAIPKPINTDFIVTLSCFIIKASMTGLIANKIKAAKL